MLNKIQSEKLFALLEFFSKSNDSYAVRLIHKQYPFNEKIRSLKFKEYIDVNANAALAYFYALTLSEDKKTNKAQRAYSLMRAAELGNPYAAYLVGEAYINDSPYALNQGLFGINKDLGYQWLTKAMSTSDPIMAPYPEARNLFKATFGLTPNDKDISLIESRIELPILSIKKEYWSGELSEFIYKLDVDGNGQVTLLRDQIVPGEVSVKPILYLPKDKVKELLAELNKLGNRNWSPSVGVDGKVIKREKYTIRINTKQFENVGSFELAPNDFDQEAFINQLLIAVIKIIPFQSYSYKAIPSTKQKFPLRELILPAEILKDEK